MKFVVPFTMPYKERMLLAARPSLMAWMTGMPPHVPADELEDDVDLGVGDEVVELRGAGRDGHQHVAGALPVGVADALDDQGRADLGLDERAVLLQELVDALADVAQAHQSHVDKGFLRLACHGNPRDKRRNKPPPDEKG
jgi:UDP-N-acetylmuramyl pentapeptide synthase